MPLEIERKFIVTSNEWKGFINKSFSIQQGYLNLDANRTVRVRIKDNEGFITIKGKTKGVTRVEFEYEIPVNEAEQLIQLCEGAIISKKRHEVMFGHKLWEIDVFEGENLGLVMAELELMSENEPFLVPDWVGNEVSNDKRYYNSALVKNPFRRWKPND